MTRRKDHPQRAVPGNWPPPRTLENPQPIVTAALNRARSLICLVRDEGPNAIGEVLDRCDTQALYALVTVLACMVPDDQSMQDLLAWLDEAPPVSRETSGPDLQVVEA